MLRSITGAPTLVPPAPHRPHLLWRADAQPLRPLFSDGWRGRDQIPRRRFPRAAAGRLRALCRERRGYPARRAEILERRFAGSLCVPRGCLSAPFPGPDETALIVPLRPARRRKAPEQKGAEP